jgi:hypothetical protein
MEGVSLLEILIWVHYKGMWIKNLPHMTFIQFVSALTELTHRSFMKKYHLIL